MWMDFWVGLIGDLGENWRFCQVFVAWQYMGHLNVKVMVHFRHVHSKSQALTFHFLIDLPTLNTCLSLTWPCGKSLLITMNHFKARLSVSVKRANRNTKKSNANRVKRQSYVWVRWQIETLQPESLMIDIITLKLPVYSLTTAKWGE